MTDNNNDSIFEPIDDIEEEAAPATEEAAVTKKEVAAKIRKNFWQLDIWQSPNYVGYKISAVVIAILIWVFVSITQNQPEYRVFNVPLEVHNLSSQLAMLESVDQVQVRVEGNSTELFSITATDIVAYIDLTGVMAGRADIEVKVDLPDNITLVSTNPKSVIVELEQSASAVFDLTVRNNITAAENYKMLDPVASPSQITLSGAEKYLDAVASVLITAEVIGITENYSQNLQVRVIDFAGNDITDKFTVSPATVSLLVPVVTDMPSKSVAVNASLVGDPAEGYQVSQIIVDPATVTAFGDLQVLSGIYYLETEPLNITGLSKNYTQTVDIIHKTDIEISQSSVTVVVQIEPIATKSFTTTVLHCQNLPSYLACSLPALSMQVEVTGPKPLVDALTSNDIAPYVDFSGTTEAGQYSLPLGVTLPANINLVSITPQEASVTVTEAGE